MSNENFGLLVIIIIGLLFLIGISSLIISIFLDKKYQQMVLDIQKRKKKEEQEDAGVIISSDSFDVTMDDIE